MAKDVTPLLASGLNDISRLPFPPEEVEGWARDWFLRYEASGGFMDGSEILNPLAALTAWLRACARRQSKRFKEVNRLECAGMGDEELSFGVEPP